MNKYLFTLLMITPLVSSGQFIKGDKFIGGTFRLSSQTPTKSDQSSTYEVKGFSIYPTMGFLLNEKFAIGGQIGYSYLNTVYNKNQSSESKYNSERFSLGLISRRYFSISDKFIFSINGQVNFDRGTETNTNSTSESKNQNYQIWVSLEPCFIFFPSPKWGLETSIGSISYSYSRNLSTDLGQNYFNLNYGTINLGLFYYFRKVN
jgi:hypothetical protein